MALTIKATYKSPRDLFQDSLCLGEILYYQLHLFIIGI